MSRIKMTRNISLLFIISFSLSFLQGCAGTNNVVSNKLIQKRKYTKGFYIERSTFSIDSKDISNANPTDKIEGEKALEPIHFLPLKVVKDFPFELKDSKEDQKEKDQYLPEEECGDTLVYITGKSVLVRIVEVGDEKISYIKCSDQNQRTYTLSKDEAGYINYLNGETELFNDPDDPKASKKKESNFDDGVIKDEPFALPSAIMVLAALILGFLTLPIIGAMVGLLAAVFGYFSLINYNKNPDKYTNRSMPIAWIAIIFGSMLFGLFLIIAIQGL